MTVQICDILFHKKFKYELPYFPLENYWELRGTYSPFTPFHTANHRGYVASWSIRDGLLFLESVTAYSPKLDKRIEYLNQIFPTANESVWAHWYSGQLRFGLNGRAGAPPRRYEISFDLEKKLKIRGGRVLDENLLYKMAR